MRGLELSATVGILGLDVSEAARAMRAASSLPTQAGEVRTIGSRHLRRCEQVVSAEAR
jgi:hypothetical protein